VAGVARGLLNLPVAKRAACEFLGSTSVKSMLETPCASEERVRTKPSAADVFAEELARWLGPHTARRAVRTFALRALGTTPEQLLQRDVSRLSAALRPMLKTLLGNSQSEQVLRAVAARFEP